jgi:hypothetical protein
MILKKIYSFSVYIFLISLIIIFLDLTINLFLPEKIKKSIGTTKNYSLKSKRFHHNLASNINLYEFWGEAKYKVVTNEYGMRIHSNDIFSEKRKNLGFMGDSFVYGSGLNYNEHFLNNVEKKKDKYNYLNLSFVGYSPSIYFKKLEFYIQEKKIDFDKIFIFIDTSDVQDEGIFYREDKNGNIVRKWNTDRENEKRNIKYIFKNYLKQNSFIFKFYETFFTSHMNKNSEQCLRNKDNITDFKKYLDYERFGYAYNDKITSKKWVLEGQEKIISYLYKIKDLLDRNNIEMVILYYPSAIDVLNDNKIKEDSKHYAMLHNWALFNNISFIDTHQFFFRTNKPVTNYKTNFITCDIHWNANGHKIIANRIINYLNN